MSLLLLAVSTSAQVQELRQGVRYAFDPVVEFLAGGARAVNSLVGAFTEVDQLRRDNRAMAARVEQLEQEVAQIEIYRSEIARLTQLLGTRRTLDHETVPAFVVQRTSNQFERVVTLDRGSESGIEVDDAVLSPGGALVGIVTEVFPGTASVRLLSDTRSLVIGIDVKTRATGEVIGDLSRPLVLDKVAATETLHVGDTITTAGQLVRGVRALLPRDLLIGSIVEVLDAPGEFVKSALVQPAADLDRLESVLVITSYEPPRLTDPGATPGPEPRVTPVPERTERPRGGRPARTPGG
jgi:rod shape-determining protein MreC